jgi:hypothetical protein
MNMGTGLTNLNNLATLGEGLCGAGGKWGQIFVLDFAIVVSSIKKLAIPNTECRLRLPAVGRVGRECGIQN